MIYDDILDEKVASDEKAESAKAVGIFAIFLGIIIAIFGGG